MGKPKLAPVDPSLSLRLLRCGPEREGRAGKPLTSISQENHSENLHPSRFLPEAPRLMRAFCTVSFRKPFRRKRTAALSQAQPLRNVSSSSSPPHAKSQPLRGTFGGQSQMDLLTLQDAGPEAKLITRGTQRTNHDP